MSDPTCDLQHELLDPYASADVRSWLSSQLFLEYLGPAQPLAPHPGDVFLPDGTRLVFRDPSDQAGKFSLALHVPPLAQPRALCWSASARCESPEQGTAASSLDRP